MSRASTNQPMTMIVSPGPSALSVLELRARTPEHRATRRPRRPRDIESRHWICRTSTNSSFRPSGPHANRGPTCECNPVIAPPCPGNPSASQTRTEHSGAVLSSSKRGGSHEPPPSGKQPPWDGRAVACTFPEHLTNRRTQPATRGLLSSWDHSSAGWSPSSSSSRDGEPARICSAMSPEF